MEVVGERLPPPSLPTKNRMNHTNGFHSDFSLKQKIIVRNEESPREELGFYIEKDGSEAVTDRMVSPLMLFGSKHKENEKSPRTLAKFANGADPRRSRFSEGKQAHSEPKIMTWANSKGNSFTEAEDPPMLSVNTFYKSTEPERDEEFLYQNVSNAGTNYIEYKLNGFIKRDKAKLDGNVRKAKNKVDLTSCDGEIVKDKTNYKVNSCGNRQIEVHQVKNKTVVKISIKDDKWKNENEFSSKSKLVKPELEQIGSGPECGTDMAAHSGQRDSEEYANILNTGELSDQQIYVNVNTSDPECDQTYENQDFEVLKNSRVIPSVLQKNQEVDDSYPQTYENLMFGGDEGTYENVCMPPVMPPGKDSNAKQCVRISMGDEVEGQRGVTDHRTMQDNSYHKMRSRKVVVTISNTQSDKSDGNESQIKKNVTDYGQNGEGHKRAESLTSSGVGVDSEESDGEGSNISCDSLNSNELNALSTSEDNGYHTPNSEHKTGSPVDGVDYQNITVDGLYTESITEVYENGNSNRGNSDEEIYENFRVFDKKKAPVPPPKPNPLIPRAQVEEVKCLPRGLLRDIQTRNVKLSSKCANGENGVNGNENEITKKIITFNELSEEKGGRKSGKEAEDDGCLRIEEKTYEERSKAHTRSERFNKICAMDVDTDQFYNFHLFENRQEANVEKSANEDETFAGIKDYLNREKQAAIKSAKGTIRGVKNRVKAGIATFLQMQENKTYKDRDAGKIVVYSTTMGIVRETYQKCLKVKQILRTLMVKFEERDVFMSTEAQDEIRERMKCDAILVPQVFVEGQHIGDAETIERLNESGELRKILKPYKSSDACSTCQVCGGYRLLPCSVCKGSKKSIHRNHFTAEFVALKCMNCDQVGLVKCYAC